MSKKDPSLSIPTPIVGGCYTLVDGKLVRDEDLAKPIVEAATAQEVPVAQEAPAKSVPKK